MKEEGIRFLLYAQTTPNALLLQANVFEVVRAINLMHHIDIEIFAACLHSHWAVHCPVDICYKNTVAKWGRIEAFWRIVSLKCFQEIWPELIYGKPCPQVTSGKGISPAATLGLMPQTASCSASVDYIIETNSKVYHQDFAQKK